MKIYMSKKIIHLVHKVRKYSWPELIAITLIGTLLFYIVYDAGYQAYQVTYRTATLQQTLRYINTLTIQQSEITLTPILLSKANFFGVEQNAKESAFTLQGILFSDKPEHVQAIITHDGQEGIYRVGDKLTVDATIWKITNNKVIFMQKGMIRIIPLSWKQME